MRSRNGAVVYFQLKYEVIFCTLVTANKLNNKIYTLIQSYNLRWHYYFATCNIVINWHFVKILHSDYNKRKKFGSIPPTFVQQWGSLAKRLILYIASTILSHVPITSLRSGFKVALVTGHRAELGSNLIHYTFTGGKQITWCPLIRKRV